MRGPSAETFPAGDGAGGEKQGGAPGSWSPAANSRQLTGVYPFDVLERRGFET